MTIVRLCTVATLAVTLGVSAAAFAADGEFRAEPRHGISKYGDLKYGPEFPFFDYVNPDAPRGGTVTLQAAGDSYDSFNPYILRGNAENSITLLYDTLMTSSLDEPTSQYGLLAETIEVPEDRSWTVFNLNPNARWHDGKPVTADDVVWTYNTLIEKGRPSLRSYFAGVEEVSAVNERRVLFRFEEGANKELPLLLGGLPVLPKHWWADRDFSEPMLDVPLGSGPYRLERFDAGRSATYVRVEDYWGADLPVNRGHNNVETLIYEYYRDRDVATEALKAGAIDFRAENSAKRWATSYDFPAQRQGFARMETLPDRSPTRMQGFYFNTRRPQFEDRKVREALGQAFDFEWTNKALMYDAYTRTNSYFPNSEMAARELPDAAELALLEPFRDQLPPEVFTTVYEPPRTDGSGELRRNLRTALKLLGEAGWTVQDGALRNADGTAFTFEVLIFQASLEKIILPFTRNLERLGIEATVRAVDVNQYLNRLRDTDFDMIIFGFAPAPSPGTELRDNFNSEEAARAGSRNLIGIRNPAVDALVETAIAAESREELVTTIRALDRVLVWNHYVIPQYYSDEYRLIYWDKFGRPPEPPTYSLGFPTIWWVDAEKQAALDAWRRTRN